GWRAPFTPEELDEARGAVEGESGKDSESLGDPSLVELADVVETERRIQPIILSFDIGTEPWIDWDNIQRASTENPEDYRSMIDQMREVMKGVGHGGNMISEKSNSDIIREFTIFARLIVRARLSRLPIAHEIDPHTTIAIEWGSKKLAHFHKRGKWENQVILNINALMDTTVLEGELLHEALHPLVSAWLEYAHMEKVGEREIGKRLFSALGTELAQGIVEEPPEEGYLANTWEWELRQDMLTFFKRAITVMLESSDEGMQEQAQSLFDYARDI
ncbi:unnamed protein product, partial [marine sediment metagenome]